MWKENFETKDGEDNAMEMLMHYLKYLLTSFISHSLLKSLCYWMKELMKQYKMKRNSLYRKDRRGLGKNEIVNTMW